MSLAKLKDRLLQKFVRDPAGYGRPVPAAAFDREYQSGSWDHFFSFAELPRNLILAGAIHHYFPQAPRVLDLGCGSGRFAQALQHYPFAGYVGVDLSPEAVTRARALALPRMEFVEGNFETWRPDGAFDAIVMNEASATRATRPRPLATFAAHLRPEGRLLVSLYRSGSYVAQWRRMERTCETVDAVAVSDATGGKTWDVRILKPRP